MSQLKFYKYATFSLLLLNILLIGFFFLHRPPHSPNNMKGKRTAMEALKLSDKQHDTFLGFAEKHVQHMHSIEEQQKELLNDYFLQLINTSKNIDSDSLLSKVQLLEREKIEKTYQHLEEVKSLLKKEQYIYFEGFMNHIMRVLLGKKREKKPSSIKN